MRLKSLSITQDWLPRQCNAVFGIVVLWGLLCLSNAYAACDSGANYYPYLVTSGNGSVLDARTGLEWQVCSSGQRWVADSSPCSGVADKYSWEQVSKVADKAWRVPTKQELQGLMNPGCNNPAVAPLLSRGDGMLYWSISNADSPQQAWAANFKSGKIVSGDKKHALAVRLVRSHNLLGVSLLKEREALVQQLQALGIDERNRWLNFSDFTGEDRNERMGFFLAQQRGLSEEGDNQKAKIAASQANKWDQKISQALQQFMRDWLNVELAADTVSLPKLPTAITLKQDSWENNAEFAQRVKQEQVKRQIEVETIQTSYRRQVEKYNFAVEDAQQVYKARRALADNPLFRVGVTRFVLGEMVPSLSVVNASLNRETNTIYLRAQVDKGSVVGQYAFAQPSPELRKTALQQATNLHLTPVFQVSKDGAFSIDQVFLVDQGKTLFGQAVQEGEQKTSSNQIAKIDLVKASQMESLAVLKKQNPNLLDQFDVGQVTFRDGSQSQLAYDDDLAPLIANLKAAPENASLWLFAIGAEKYKASDNIQFARRSAESFVQATQKSLGIPKGHVFALYDEDATGNSIKGRLKQVLTTGIKKGDTVIFYYNGHGVPVPADDNMAYLMPTDTIPDFVADDGYFRLNNLYKTLQDSVAGKVIVLLDSCFTGQTDGKSVFKGDKAATRLAPKKVAIDESKVAVLTAGTDNQYASAYADKGYRLFTYFVIKELLNQRRSVQELHQAVAVNVRDQSRKNGAQGWQDPQLNGDSSGRSSLTFE